MRSALTPTPNQPLNSMSDRIYPLAKPPGHKPPMERWKLEFPDDSITIQTVYIGIQRHDVTPDSLGSYNEAIHAVQEWLATLQPENQIPTEKFTFLEGDDTPESTVWVCYFSNTTTYSTSMHTLSLTETYKALAKPRNIGLWTEQFTSQTNRLETNYSGLDYLPGLARLPGSNPIGHKLTAYWGAARDRIPDSGHDLFTRASAESTAYPSTTPRGLGERLHGQNSYDNLVHIRSGQFWANCTEIERQAYEEHLEPTLLSGLRYLWCNRDESGAMGLRFLRNGHHTTRSAQSRKRKREKHAQQASSVTCRTLKHGRNDTRLIWLSSTGRFAMRRRLVRRGGSGRGMRFLF
ncbi:hem-containing dehydratase-domain containing protein [Aspergillus californicus]